MLELRDDIGLPDPRSTLPTMGQIAGSHPQLNLLNHEAAAAAQVLVAEVWLSPPTASGVLPAVLDANGLRWRVVDAM